MVYQQKKWWIQCCVEIFLQLFHHEYKYQMYSRSSVYVLGILWNMNTESVDGKYYCQTSSNVAQNFVGQKQV